MNCVRYSIALAAYLVASCAGGVRAQESPEAQIGRLVPALEAYVQRGMKDFDNPGLAIGIVTKDRLVYAQGFGTRKKGGEPVDPKTVFQIGSTTKAFLATTMAIAVDRKKLAWDDRVFALDPEFELKDPWVTREFRVFDLLAQRSGLPPFVNDSVGLLGADRQAMIRSLRAVDPVSSFRSTFAYTNITHMVAQRIVARQLGAADWESVVRDEIFAPLGMRDSSFTAQAIEAAANHAVGYRWTAAGSVEVPFTPVFPYEFGGAGAINATIEDLAPWVRLHLNGGALDGKRIVSSENLAVTKVARIGMSDRLSYAMGWVLQSTPNGEIVWHNGGTTSFGAYIGMAADKGLGVVVLTNESNVGFPDAVGEWALDRLMGNPDVDHVAKRLEAAKAGEAASRAAFANPPQSRQPVPSAEGTFTNGSFGAAVLSVSGDTLTMQLSATGAKLRLEPWSNGAFAVSLVPEGRFAAVAANLGPLPMGFAQFLVDKEGGLSRLRLTMQDGGQTYEFTRP
jgi:CubicO group peptidase (beta-lactamase class C family)